MIWNYICISLGFSVKVHRMELNPTTKYWSLHYSLFSLQNTMKLNTCENIYEDNFMIFCDCPEI